MTESIQTLDRKISSAEDLHGIVRSMKAMALSNISMFEQAVLALNGYSQIIETSLGACFREIGPVSPVMEKRIAQRRNSVTVIVFGSDHGLVGPFNDVIASFVNSQVDFSRHDLQIHAIGERVRNRLTSMGAKIVTTFPVPNSVPMITSLVGSILQQQVVADEPAGSTSELHVFFNQPVSGFSYDPVRRQILPFNQQLRSQWAAISWPTALIPEIMGGGTVAIRTLLREFLFVSLYRACALSLASENASRLAAMQRADRNIEDLLVELKHDYHQLRQNEIDTELFDIISGYEALEIADHRRTG